MNAPQQPPLETAIELHRAGLSVIPIKADGSKMPPIAWKRFQQDRAVEQEIREWFAQPSSYALGVVTGAVSGNLEMCEVEGRAMTLLTQARETAHGAGLGPVWEKVTNGWVEMSPGGGLHWFYRTEDPTPGNQKIAKDAARQVLAETRGEGGLVVVAPSGGTAHSSGKPWLRIAGGPATMPTLSTDERDAFHGILAMVMGAPAPEPEQETLQAPAAGIFSQAPATANGLFDGETPGDDYEKKTSWADILTGWTPVFKDRAGATYWRRPGKTEGFSATTGRDSERDRLYVFSTSTEFETEIPITKFHAYAVLHHHGDHSAAAGALRKTGYGSEPRISAPPVTPLHQAARAQETAPAAPETAPAQLATVTALHPRQQAAPALAAAPAPAGSTPLHSDDGNALLLIDRYGAQLRFCYDKDRWLAWDGHRWEWQPRGGGHARELAKDVARSMPENNDAARKHKRSSLSAAGISNTLKQAETDARMRVALQDLDAHAWELNTPGGIIDLTTGQLLAPDPAKLHTRSTTYAPNFEAETTLWDEFLETTFPNNPALIGYMQRLVGYSAVGEVTAHILPFGFGSGGNGKGVFLETITAILGDYASASPNGFLMAQKFQQHPTEIAELSGARFVVCSEVNEDDRFDEAKVKRLTGGDTLKGRFMGKDNFSFRPTHHLWLVGNFQPAVESGGDSFWRRLRQIPFTHSVPDNRVIEGLSDKLAGEYGPAILAWIARGAADFRARGLMEPEQVKAATKDYAASVDTVGRFLEDDCERVPTATVTVHAMRAAYEKWCEENGERPVNGRSFSTQLDRHGVGVGKNAPRGPGGTRLYSGVVLTSRQQRIMGPDGEPQPAIFDAIADRYEPGSHRR